MPHVAIACRFLLQPRFPLATSAYFCFQTTFFSYRYHRCYCSLPLFILSCYPYLVAPFYRGEFPFADILGSARSRFSFLNAAADCCCLLPSYVSSHSGPLFLLTTIALLLFFSAVCFCLLPQLNAVRFRRLFATPTTC